MAGRGSRRGGLRVMDRAGGEWEIRRPLVRVLCGGAFAYVLADDIDFSFFYVHKRIINFL